MREEVGFAGLCPYTRVKSFFAWQKKIALSSDLKMCPVLFISRTMATQLVAAKEYSSYKGQFQKKRREEEMEVKGEYEVIFALRV